MQITPIMGGGASPGVRMNLFNQQSFCENTPKLDNNEIIFIAHKLNSIFAYRISTYYYYPRCPSYYRGGFSLSR